MIYDLKIYEKNHIAGGIAHTATTVSSHHGPVLNREAPLRRSEDLGVRREHCGTGHCPARSTSALREQRRTLLKGMDGKNNQGDFNGRKKAGLFEDLPCRAPAPKVKILEHRPTVRRPTHPLCPRRFIAHIF